MTLFLESTYFHEFRNFCDFTIYTAEYLSNVYIVQISLKLQNIAVMNWKTISAWVLKVCIDDK